MPDWRSELDSLLTQLDDAAGTNGQPPRDPTFGRGDGLARHPVGTYDLEDSGSAWELAA